MTASVESKSLQITPGCGIALWLGQDQAGQGQQCGASLVVGKKRPAQWRAFNDRNSMATQHIAEHLGTRWWTYRWLLNGAWAVWMYRLDGEWRWEGGVVHDF